MSHPIKPIEICAQCGSPIIDTNRIYCKTCGAHIVEGMSVDVLPITKQEPTLINDTSIPSNPKANEWKLIVKLIVQSAGLAIIIFFMLFLLFMASKLPDI
jgi:hypothetical protein